MAVNQGHLVAADPLEVRSEMGLADPGQVGATQEADPALDQQAGEFVDQVLALSAEELAQGDTRNANITAVENLGAQAQREAAHRSGMLREPIRKLASRGEDGGPVAQSLVDLKMTVEELDPGKFDFEAGWFSRTLGFLPGIGKPIKRYFTMFESSQTVLDAIVRALNEGRNTLLRDNTTLLQDQKVMRQLTLKLEKTIQLGLLIDQKMAYALEREIGPDDPRRAFIEQELLFPLRQRIQDLQQQLAVNQQGVLAIEIIIRNNKELIKGVNRAINVTVNALNVAVTVALALANQKDRSGQDPGGECNHRKFDRSDGGHLEDPGGFDPKTGIRKPVGPEYAQKVLRRHQRRPGRYFQFPVPGAAGHGQKYPGNGPVDPGNRKRHPAAGKRRQGRAVHRPGSGNVIISYDNGC